MSIQSDTDESTSTFVRRRIADPDDVVGLVLISRSRRSWCQETSSIRSQSVTPLFASRSPVVIGTP
jgi:hypothetical protein